MNGIVGRTPAEIALELEVFARSVIADRRFGGAAIFVARKMDEGGCYFTIAALSMEARMASL